MMRRKWLAGVLAVLMLTPTALADAYEGTTAANVELQLTAQSSGTLENVNVQTGSTVTVGETIANVKTTKVFAGEDGTVARIFAEEGETVSGTVLEVYPVQRYEIYCTVSDAYQSAESTLVHSGEQIYIKCTANGTHRGVGIITEIDGEEFHVFTIGGELYVGETVYLYRDEEFTSSQRIGIGTVVTSDTQTYGESETAAADTTQSSAAMTGITMTDMNMTQAYGTSGTISIGTAQTDTSSSCTVVKMCVSEGEYIQRGELLYEVIQGDEAAVTASADGIISSVSAEEGESVQDGESIATLVPQDEIIVQIQVDEEDISSFKVGDAVTLIYAADSTETERDGTVLEVGRIAENGKYTVKIRPKDTADLKLGLTVTVRTNED